MKKSVRNSIVLGICAAAIASQTAGFAAGVSLAAGGCSGKGGCNNRKPKKNERMAVKRQAIK